MVMTGFLPSHSIETHLPEEKIEGKVEALKGLVRSQDTQAVVTTLLSTSERFYRDPELVDKLLAAVTGLSGELLASAKVLTRTRRELVWELVTMNPNAVAQLDKERMLNLLKDEAGRFTRPAVFMPDGSRKYYDSPEQLASDLETFVEWVRAVAGYAFNSISDDDTEHAVYLQAINFDVPTEQPLRVIVHTDGDEIHAIDVPWYGRRVIARAMNDFTALLMIAMTQELS